ncbi:hypothetical protein SBA4_3810005 [Candidatus Sulfopaludibacter sp. SbA4]|nr:hypothetical protein SBA4_3810005 [Candidatus Sulfopaludibacter sp. SbA4]
MEPVRPDVRRAILDANPQASRADMEEYERLLSLRFTRDPDAPRPSLAPRNGAESQADIEERLSQLHEKLFPARAQRLRTEDR